LSVATRWAWKQSQAGPRKLVLLALADSANDQGECSPAVRCLAHRCGMSDRNVQRHLRELERSGLIAIGEQQGPSGTNRYWLLLGASAHVASSPDGRVTSASPRQIDAGDAHVTSPPTFTSPRFDTSVTGGVTPVSPRASGARSTGLSAEIPGRAPRVGAPPTGQTQSPYARMGRVESLVRAAGVPLRVTLFGRAQRAGYGGQERGVDAPT
jgi:DNA-binding transcriptional ArsR family regulator